MLSVAPGHTGLVRAYTTGGNMQPAQCILFSGAAQGAEAAFGAAAERHGLEVVYFTFEGHNATRTRGMRVLTQAELQQGDVSLAYVSPADAPHVPATPPCSGKCCRCIWHQVRTSWPGNLCRGGIILEDGTVKGGTGWGAEFAKLCKQAAVRLCPRPGALVSLDGRVVLHR